MREERVRKQPTPFVGARSLPLSPSLLMARRESQSESSPGRSLQYPYPSFPLPHSPFLIIYAAGGGFHLLSSPLSVFSFPPSFFSTHPLPPLSFRSSRPSPTPNLSHSLPSILLSISTDFTLEAKCTLWFCLLAQSASSLSCFKNTY